jgi:hypothetical protein
MAQPLRVTIFRMAQSPTRRFYELAVDRATARGDQWGISNKSDVRLRVISGFTVAEPA